MGFVQLNPSAGFHVAIEIACEVYDCVLRFRKFLRMRFRVVGTRFQIVHKHTIGSKACIPCVKHDVEGIECQLGHC